MSAGILAETRRMSPCRVLMDIVLKGPGDGVETARMVGIEIGLYRHRVEKHMVARESWLANVLDGIGDGVIATDATGWRSIACRRGSPLEIPSLPDLLECPAGRARTTRCG